MRRFAFLLAIVALVGFVDAGPALSQDDSVTTDNATATTAPSTDPSSAAPDDDEAAVLPVCPPERTTTIIGGLCTVAVPPVVTPVPSFSTLGTLAGTDKRWIRAGLSQM